MGDANRKEFLVMECGKMSVAEKAVAEYRETCMLRAAEIERRVRGIEYLYEKKEALFYGIDSMEVSEQLKESLKKGRFYDEIDQRIMCKANRIRMAIRSVIVSRIKMVRAVRQAGGYVTFSGEIFLMRSGVETWAREKYINGRPLKEWLFDSTEDVRRVM